MATTEQSETIRYLGTNCNAVGTEAFERAGVDPATHAIVTWHDRGAAERARAEGRLVATFRVRGSDPECYVVRSVR